MSRHMYELLATLCPETELYSINEMLMSLADFAGRDLVAMAQQARATVLQWTGIPTCVGISLIRTLAKRVNAAAKKIPSFGGACDLTAEAARHRLLDLFPVEDVWGIGRATVG